MDILFTIVSSIILGIGLFVICRPRDDDEEEEEEDAPDEPRKT